MVKTKIMLCPEHRLALRKSAFEAQAAQSKVDFMLEQHAQDTDSSFLESETYRKLTEDAIAKKENYDTLQTGLIQEITGRNSPEDSFRFYADHEFIEITSRDRIPAAERYGKEARERKSGKRFMQFPDFIAMAYPELHGYRAGEKKRNFESPKEKILSKTVTFQVTDACNLACTYCYQINKGKRRMPFELAKEFVDKLLSGEDGFGDYINPENSPGIVIEFIGGEPFLEVELIDQIVDYFRLRCIETGSPWADKYCVSICSNGVLYKDPKVQRFLQKNRNNISFSVTLDGNKELHDKCRVFPDGKGSYDIAEEAAKDWMARGYYMGSKITISPDNLPYISDALEHITNLGYTDINANCIYEAEWTAEQAGQFYHLMKDYADLLLSSEEYRNVECSLYSDTMGKPKEETEIDNWCGGTGSMLAMDPDGWLFPCIRYMESSLGNTRKPLRIGHVHTGIAQCKEHKDCVNCLNAVTRRTESTDECFYCPIASGCSWCSAYNYQCFGTVDQRSTNICEVHKGRVLANVYYWNRYYEKYGMDRAFNLWVPEAWAIPIIGKEEYEMLAALAESRGGTVNRNQTMIKGYREQD